VTVGHRRLHSRGLPPPKLVAGGDGCSSVSGRLCRRGHKCCYVPTLRTGRVRRRAGDQQQDEWLNQVAPHIALRNFPSIWRAKSPACA
jgi:hypothetical protein